MKNKPFVITILIVLIILCINIVIPQSVYAKSWLEGAEGFIKDGEEDSQTTVIDTEDMQTMSDMLYNAFLIVGIIVAVVIGLTIGIKFMTGSVAEKAEIKKTLVPYIAGCIVLFGAFTIWKLVVTLLSSANS